MTPEKVSYRLAAERVGLMAQIEYLTLEADRLEREKDAIYEQLLSERNDFEERALKRVEELAAQYSSKVPRRWDRW
jgi:hypothetical protein